VLEKHVDFKGLSQAIDQAAPRPSRAKGGRPPFPTEVMVRVMVLQQLYNLSDEQMEFQLLDRLSFQRFVGLRHSSQIPDRTTLWTFKERLVEANASETLFDAVNRELNKHGYLARCGQIIDATLVPAPRQQLNKDEKALVKQDAMQLTGNLPSAAKRTLTRPGRRNTASRTLVISCPPASISVIS
jgi:IS5 family transposase